MFTHFNFRVCEQLQNNYLTYFCRIIQYKLSAVITRGSFNLGKKCLFDA